MSGVETYRLMANFHQFLLTGESREFEDLRLPVDGALVSAESSQVVVRTGAYAAPVEVGLELLRLEPSEPDSIWEDVVELSVLSADRIALAELMEAPKGAIATEAGWYRLRIAARGRDAGEERGEVGQRAKVLEHYLVQAWAAPAAPGTTIRATSLRPVDHALRRTYLAGARAAADRINADLDRSPGHRALSRATGSVSVEWAYRATRRKLFLPMAFLNYWTSASSSSSGNTVEVGAQYSLSNNEDRDIFDGIPTSSRGHVLATLVEVDRPNFVVTRWQWLDSPYYGQGQPILGLETSLRIRLEQAVGSGGRPQTTVHLEHHGLPVEWLEDMRTVWLCKLESGDSVYPLAR